MPHYNSVIKYYILSYWSKVNSASVLSPVGQVENRGEV